MSVLQSIVEMVSKLIVVLLHCQFINTLRDSLQRALTQHFSLQPLARSVHFFLEVSQTWILGLSLATYRKTAHHNRKMCGRAIAHCNCGMTVFALLTQSCTHMWLFILMSHKCLCNITDSVHAKINVEYRLYT